jgi:hypothetical protein
MRLPCFLHLLSLFFNLAHGTPEIESRLTNGGVESVALRPLILRANAYLSVGQFVDAARTYTEALRKCHCVPD